MGVKGNKGKQGGVGLRHLLQLPSCSPFLKPETFVPLKHAIVHMGSGQHGQVLGFTKCRHDLPDNLRLAVCKKKIVVQSLKRFPYYPPCCCANIEAAIGEDEAAKPQSIAQATVNHSSPEI